MIESLLGSRLRARVIRWIFTHPDQRCHVRRLARLVGEDSTNVGRELKRLAALGLLAATTEGRQTYYQALKTCPVFTELRGLAVKTQNMTSTRHRRSEEPDPVVALLLDGGARTLEEAQEHYLNSHIPEVVNLVEGPLSDEEFRRHPLISLLLACGSRGWEDSLT
ncbi:MAG: hypothetical protein HYY18_22260 [Planctomycetes bacterium]|nr:hypothetical protein [Planctomycetota bacterium]